MRSAKSIFVKLLVGTGESRGQGAVEAIERLVRAEVKGFKRGEGPCAFAALGRCKGTLPSGSPCGECAFQKEAAKKGEAIVSPPRKRKNVFEMLGGIQASPSPASSKLSRNSSFSAAARDRVSKQRNIL